MTKKLQTLGKFKFTTERSIKREKYELNGADCPNHQALVEEYIATWGKVA